jgi:hypothetical protein
MNDPIQSGTVGLPIRLVLLDGGNVHDPSTATHREIRIMRPRGAGLLVVSGADVSVGVTSFEDGERPCLEYVTRYGDLDEAGHYTVRGYIEDPEGQWPTGEVWFEVHKLDGAPFLMGDLQVEILSARRFKRNDTWPMFKARLTAGGQPVNLTSATQVRLLLHSSRRELSLMMDVSSPPERGEVRCAWQAGDLGVSGLYTLEIEVTFGGGEVMTAPGSGYREIEVVDDLG